MSARQHEERGGAGDSGNLGYPRRPEPGAVLLSTCHRHDQRTRSNLTANSTEHLPDWPAQNVGKMLPAFCGCVWLTDQFFDLTGIAEYPCARWYYTRRPEVARRVRMRHSVSIEYSQD